MNETLLNEEFTDYIFNIVEKKREDLRKIKEYDEYRKKYTAIQQRLESEGDEKCKDIIDCIFGMSLYEEAFAYYLGMLHIINMYELHSKH